MKGRNLLLSGLILISLLVFVLFPVWKTLELSFSGATATYSLILNQDWLQDAVCNSFILGISTATLSVLVGISFALLVAKSRSRVNFFLSKVALLPMISPPFVLSLALILLFGSNGIISRNLQFFGEWNLYGFWGILMIQTLSFFPLAFLSLVGALRSIDGSIEEASMSLGASKTQTLKNISLPLLRPALLAGWLIVFVTSLADFSTPMLLGQNFHVLSVEAYQQFTGAGDLSLGAALSISLLIPCLLAFLLQQRLLHRRSFTTITGKPRPGSFDMLDPLPKICVSVVAGFALTLVFCLYGSVLIGCFLKRFGVDNTFTLDHFRDVFRSDWTVIFETILLAAFAAPVAAFFGSLIAILLKGKNRGAERYLEFLGLAPIALPGTAIGIGYVLAFNNPPLALVGTGWIIFLSYVFRYFPVAMQNSKSRLLQIDPSIEEAAQSLGASPTRVMKDITFPLLKPALFSGMVYVFVHSMTAVSAVIFLVSARWRHMTQLILAKAERLDVGPAAILSLILVCVVLLVFQLFEKILARSTSI